MQDTNSYVRHQIQIRDVTTSFGEVGTEVVDLAREHDLHAHVGNPGGADGLVWAYRTGFDSTDTTTVFQNQYWHYLDRLERATEETGASPARDSSQSGLEDWQPARRLG